MRYDRASGYSRIGAARSRRGNAAPGGRELGSRRVVRALRRHPVLYGIAALMAISLMAGMATGFDLAFRLVYLLAGIVVITYGLAKLGARQISAEVQRPLGPFAVGDTYRETVTVRNHGRTPKAWVEVEDKTNIPGMAIRQIGSLGMVVPFNRVEVTGTLIQRGEYEIGPLVVRASDPLNLFPQEVEFEGVDKVLVYPRVVNVPDFASPAIHLTGDGSRRQRANIISTDVSSVREYTAGDSVSRIHWLSTARVNQLMVKQFDRGSASHVWVLFDQHRDSQAGQSPESTDEYAATVAASVVDRYGRSMLPIGYSAHGSEPLVMIPDRSSYQMETIMRHIASSRPEGTTPMIELLAEMDRELSQTSSLVVITAADSGGWIDALAGLQRRGIRVNTVLVDRGSFGGEPNEAALMDLVNSGVRTFHLQQGASIPDSLSVPVGAGAGITRPSLGHDVAVTAEAAL